MKTQTRLGELRKGATGRILSIEQDADGSTRRFLEMGLIEGSEFELIHEAPFSRDPIAIRVRGSVIALRRSEANRITIQE